MLSCILHSRFIQGSLYVWAFNPARSKLARAVIIIVRAKPYYFIIYREWLITITVKQASFFKKVVSLYTFPHKRAQSQLFVNESITHLPNSDVVVARVSVLKPHENFFDCEYHHDFRFHPTFAKCATPYRPP